VPPTVMNTEPNNSRMGRPPAFPPPAAAGWSPTIGGGADGETDGAPGADVVGVDGARGAGGAGDGRADDEGPSLTPLVTCDEAF
jgi:hypothetical protein